MPLTTRGGVLRGSFRVQATDTNDVARRRLRLLALMACSRGAAAVTTAVRAGLQAAGVAPSHAAPLPGVHGADDDDDDEGYDSGDGAESEGEEGEEKEEDW